jgi:hypothetical protein
LGLGGVAFFVFFCAAKNSRVTAALSIAAATTTVSFGMAAAVVSVDIVLAVSVSFALDSVLLLHADARARIPHEITKNFAFIFF